MTASARPRLVIIDIASLLHRAYHAVPQHFSTADGEPTNAVYGFTAMLFRLVEELRPEYAVAAFDPPGGTFRHERYEAYKANRPAADEALTVQFGRVRQLIEVLGIPAYELPGYEADDLLGTLAGQADHQGLDVYLVTGDRDAWQLVGPHVRVLSSNPRSGAPVIYDEAAVKDRWGIGPEQVVDFKALLGDSSDNIPGVAGIGEKTASSLLGQYRDLEDIYAHLDELKPAVRRRLEGQREIAELSRELATIVTDLPVSLDLERSRLWQADRGKVDELFRELQFRSLLERVPFGNGAASPPAAGIGAPSVKPASIDDAAQARDLALTLAGAELVGLYPIVRSTLAGPELLALGIAWDGASATLACDGKQADRLSALHDWFGDQARAKVAFDSKLLYRALAAQGIRLAGVRDDLLLAAYVADPSSTPRALDDLALRRRAWELQPPVPEPAAAGGFAGLDAPDLTEAAAVRAAAALALAEELRSDLSDERLTALLDDLELPLAPVLAEMEMRGVALDVEALRVLSVAMQAEIRDLESAIHAAAGKAFNINSPKQLGVILFEELGLPAGRRTKSGYSTAVGVLEQLVEAHPIVGRVLEYRAISKLRSTYVQALPELIDPGTGRVHTTFNQAVTATGRLSSTNPNLQNIPIRTERGREIRRAFVAGGEDMLLLSVDYSQIDLRVLAHFSEDAAMCQAFADGQDIHTATAARLYGVAMDAVTADMRRIAKTTNFGIVYGISAQGLAQRTELSHRDAATFIQSYFGTYPGVQDYMDRTLVQARERGYVETLLGRRRYVPELNARAHHERAAAERMAINMPIQGTSADIIKVAMVDLAREIRSRRLRAHMLLQVHDELLFEVPRTELDELIPLVKERMSGAVPLRVPVAVDAKVGPNWRDMQET